ncbi:4551_t:CDS:2, partial [Paraglomus brasilianum]
SSFKNSNMITVQMKTRFFGAIYQKTYPTELQDHIRQDEFCANVEALNKPLKTSAVRLAWIGLVELLLSGGFSAMLFVPPQNISRDNAEIMMCLAMAMYFMSQLMIGEERKCIISKFNFDDRQRGIKWKCINESVWPFCIKRLSILIELDAPLHNEKANELTKSHIV